MPSSTTSNYLHNKVMQEILYGTAFSPASSLYVALYTTAPGLDGTGGTEVSASGNTNYSRVEIPCTNSYWSTPSGNNLEYSNLQAIEWPLAPGASWGEVKAAGLLDSGTVGQGNLYYVASLTAFKTIGQGDGAPKILTGQLKIARATC